MSLVGTVVVVGAARLSKVFYEPFGDFICHAPFLPTSSHARFQVTAPTPARYRFSAFGSVTLLSHHRSPPFIH